MSRSLRIPQHHTGNLEKAVAATPVFLSGESHGQRSKPGGLQSMGSQRVGHDRATKHKGVLVFVSVVIVTDTPEI